MNTKKKFPWKETILSLLMIVASYAILFFLPRGERILGYFLLGVSALLFILGYFRLIAVLPKPEEPAEADFMEIAFTLAAIAMVVIGARIVCIEGGSVRGIIVATLLLIESCVVAAYTAEEEEEGISLLHRKRCFLLRMAAIGMAVFAVYFVIRKDFSMPSVSVAVMLIIAALVYWPMSAVKD